MNGEDLAAMAIVRTGFALDDDSDEYRCLNFRVQMGLEAALDSVRAIDSYNEFCGERVALALEQIASGLNGYEFKVMLGRENSPVAYIEVPANRQNDAMALLREAAADEVDLEGDGRWIRAWWD